MEQPSNTGMCKISPSAH